MITRSDDRRRGAMNAHDLDALHAAAAPDVYGRPSIEKMVEWAAASWNAYASGDLVYPERPLAPCGDCTGCADDTCRLGRSERTLEAMCEWLAGKVSDRDALCATRDGGTFRSPAAWLAAAREAVRDE